jgi:hypothetical protein
VTSMSALGQKQTHALQQRASYSIASSAVVTLETGHGGPKQRERDFREKDKAIIRATGKKKARKKFQAFVHSD